MVGLCCVLPVACPQADEDAQQAVRLLGQGHQLGGQLGILGTRRPQRGRARGANEGGGRRGGEEGGEEEEEQPGGQVDEDDRGGDDEGGGSQGGRPTHRSSKVPSPLAITVQNLRGHQIYS